MALLYSEFSQILAATPDYKVKAQLLNFGFWL